MAGNGRRRSRKSSGRDLLSGLGRIGRHGRAGRSATEYRQLFPPQQGRLRREPPTATLAIRPPACAAKPARTLTSRGGRPQPRLARELRRHLGLERGEVVDDRLGLLAACPGRTGRAPAGTSHTGLIGCSLVFFSSGATASSRRCRPMSETPCRNSARSCSGLSAIARSNAAIAASGLFNSCSRNPAVEMRLGPVGLQLRPPIEARQRLALATGLRELEADARHHLRIVGPQCQRQLVVLERGFARSNALAPLRQLDPAAGA